MSFIGKHSFYLTALLVLVALGLAGCRRQVIQAPPVGPGQTIQQEVQKAATDAAAQVPQAEVVRSPVEPADMSRVELSPGARGSMRDRVPPELSADGHWLAFDDFAQPDGPSWTGQSVFLQDRTSGMLSVLSRGQGGTVENASSTAPSISGDGRWVAFSSSSSNLAAGDGNNQFDIFLLDTQTSQALLISASAQGQPGNAGSTAAHISEDGRYVVFQSLASNLVDGDDNQKSDIFIYDTQAGKVSLIPQAGETSGSSSLPFVSADGRYVAYYADMDGPVDVVVFDTTAGQEIYRTQAAGKPLGIMDFNRPPSLSADGRFLVFQAQVSHQPQTANIYIDGYIRDLQAGETLPIAPQIPADRAVRWPVISSDGRWVAFSSPADGLVSGDANGFEDVFLLDRSSGALSLVSSSPAGAAGDGRSYAPAISADGKHVAFLSEARNLLSYWDNNGVVDLFVRDLGEPFFARQMVVPEGAVSVTDPYPGP